MFILHYAPDNASLIIRLVLEEMGLPYETRLVDRSLRQHDSAAYRVLNPAGLIPVLETPQGPISETAAIVLWLSERAGQMAPPPGDPQRAAFLKTLFFVSNTLHADLRMSFYPSQYVGDDPAAQSALLDTVTLRLQRHFRILDDLAARRPEWIGGETPSVLDCYLGPVMRWAQIYGAASRGWFDPSAYPALMALALRLETRQSVARAVAREGLGEAPFSNPRPCNPPEGSALG